MESKGVDERVESRGPRGVEPIVVLLMGEPDQVKIPEQKPRARDAPSNRDEVIDEICRQGVIRGRVDVSDRERKSARRRGQTGRERNGTTRRK